MAEDIAGFLVMNVIKALATGGTAHAYVPYVVAERSPDKATEAVRAVVASDSEVKIVGPLPQSYLDAFELAPGEFTHGRLIP